jgi:hypothetical protein
MSRTRDRIRIKLEPITSYTPISSKFKAQGNQCQLHGGKTIWKIDKCTKQLALTVSKNAKYHSSHQETSQFDAKSVSGKTDHKEVLAETTAVIVDSTTGTTTDSETTGQEKCTKQLAQIAVSNAKYHSSQHKESQFDAKNASAHLVIRKPSNF